MGLDYCSSVETKKRLVAANEVCNSGPDMLPTSIEYSIPPSFKPRFHTDVCHGILVESIDVESVGIA